MLANREKATVVDQKSATVFPFWLIVMIPILASRKKRQLTQEKKAKIWWLMVGLAALVWLIMLLGLFKMR